MSVPTHDNLHMCILKKKKRPIARLTEKDGEVLLKLALVLKYEVSPEDASMCHDAGPDLKPLDAITIKPRFIAVRSRHAYTHRV